MSEIDMLDGNRVIGHIIKRLREKILQIGQERSRLKNPICNGDVVNLQKAETGRSKICGRKSFKLHAQG